MCSCVDCMVRCIQSPSKNPEPQCHALVLYCHAVQSLNYEKPDNKVPPPEKKNISKWTSVSFRYSLSPLPLHPLSLSWPPSAYPLPFSLPPSTHSPSLFPACFQFMSVSLTRWVITFMVGLFTGVVVSGIDYFIELLSGWKINTIKQSIHQHPSPSLYASCACISDA